MAGVVIDNTYLLPATFWLVVNRDTLNALLQNKHVRKSKYYILPHHFSCFTAVSKASYKSYVRSKYRILDH